MINKKKGFYTLIAFILSMLAIYNINNKKQDLNQIIVGISLDNPPYEYLDNTKLAAGIDVDIIKLIGKELKKEIIIKNIDLNGLIPALQSQNIDLVISGIEQTDARSKMVDFSIPYLSTSMAVVYNTLGGEMKNIQDLSGKIVGVQSSSSWESYAHKLSKKDNSIEVRSLPNNLNIITELKLHTVNAMIVETSQAKIFTNHNKKLNYFSIPDTTSYFAIAVNKKSRVLLKDVNRVLLHLKNTGKIRDIVNKYSDM